MGFRLVSKLVTLNSAVAVILRYFTKCGSFGADYAKVVEDGPIKFAHCKYCPCHIID